MADIIPKAFDGMTLSLVAVPLKGNPGEQGKGLRGDPGDSNYQLWLKAGNTGSLEDFLLAMKGEKGEDGQGLTNRGDWEVGPYQPGDYVFSAGTQTAISMWIYRGSEEFISLIPPDEDTDNWIEFAADTGKPIELRNNGEKIQWRIQDAADWIDLIFVSDLRGPTGLKGDKGDKGDAGTGLNNRGTWAAGTYQPGDYVFAAGTVATSSMWILSSTTAYVSNTAPANDLTHWIEFAAPAGPAGEQGDDGLSVNLRKTSTAIQYQQTGGPWTDLVPLSDIKGDKGDQGIQGVKGDTGLTGKSAYQSALDGGFVGTEIQWNASLKGTKGDTGTAGKSAYQSAVDSGFSGTEAQWTASLKGVKGDTGTQGIQGIQGVKGDKGDKGDTGPAASYTEGTYAARPAPGIAGSTYYATDIRETYRSNGTNWVLASTGGVVLASVAVEASGLSNVNEIPITSHDFGLSPFALVPNAPSLIFTCGQRPFIVTLSGTMRGGQANETWCVQLEVNGTIYTQLLDKDSIADNWKAVVRSTKPLTFAVGTTITCRIRAVVGGTTNGALFTNAADPLQIVAMSV